MQRFEAGNVDPDQLRTTVSSIGSKRGSRRIRRSRQSRNCKIFAGRQFSPPEFGVLINTIKLFLL